MKTIKAIFLITMSIFAISACSRVEYRKNVWRIPILLPESDIIFNTISEPREGENFGDELVGFYTFSDQSIKMVRLPSRTSPIQPFFYDKDSILAMNKLDNFGVIHEGRAFLAFYSNTDYLECPKLIGQSYSQNGKVYFFGMDGIQEINPFDCTVEKTIVTSDDLSAILDQYQFGPGSLSLNEDFLIVISNYQLLKIIITEKTIFDYKRQGTNPVISPDQQKVAYLGLDGIHIMDITGENDNLVVPYIAWREVFGHFERAIVPTPNWSIDNSMLTYHKCNLPANEFCDDINNYDVYIYDIKTQTEKLIVKGGLNPSWNCYKSE